MQAPKERVHVDSSSTSMHQLPTDVLLQVCEWLSVRDILALRRLNRFFYSFTRISNIWLSVLRRLRLPLPPCQPILGIPGYPTVEDFISRSMRFQQNWRWNYNPYPKHYTFTSQHPVNAMVILPGGNHMVSLHEGNDGIQDLIIVWDMLSRGKRNHVPVAMIRSRTAVAKLQARYALVGGHVSLVIAYVRPTNEGRTTVVAMSAHLAVLNEMSRLIPGTNAYEEFMKRSAEPFENLLEVSTRYSIGATSLSEIDGIPFLAVVHRPRTIVLYNLVSKARSLLKLQASQDFLDWRHSVWCIKILPSQKQILVVRVLIDTEPDSSGSNPIVFELYDIPPTANGNSNSFNHGEESPAAPVQRRVILNENIEGCYISDGDNSWNFRTHPDCDVPILHMLTRTPPPPLSIFVVTKQKRGFIHFISTPAIRSAENMTGYYYDLPVIAHTRYDWEEMETPVVFPGGYRSIVIMRPALSQLSNGISIQQLCTYRTNSYEFSGPEETGYCDSERILDWDDMQIDQDIRETIHNPVDRAIKHPVLPKDLVVSMRRGTRCLQFDEWLGRLFITTTNNPCLIHVLDWSL